MKQIFAKATKEQPGHSDPSDSESYIESFEILSKKELSKRFPNQNNLLVIVDPDVCPVQNQYESSAYPTKSRSKDAVYILSKHLPFVF